MVRWRARRAGSRRAALWLRSWPWVPGMAEGTGGGSGDQTGRCAGGVAGARTPAAQRGPCARRRCSRRLSRSLVRTGCWWPTCCDVRTACRCAAWSAAAAGPGPPLTAGVAARGLHRCSPVQLVPAAGCAHPACGLIAAGAVPQARGVPCAVRHDREGLAGAQVAWQDLCTALWLHAACCGAGPDAQGCGEGRLPGERTAMLEAPRLFRTLADRAGGGRQPGGPQRHAQQLASRHPPKAAGNPGCKCRGAAERVTAQGLRALGLSTRPVTCDAMTGRAQPRVDPFRAMPAPSLCPVRPHNPTSGAALCVPPTAAVQGGAVQRAAGVRGRAAAAPERPGHAGHAAARQARQRALAAARGGPPAPRAQPEPRGGHGPRRAGARARATSCSDTARPGAVPLRASVAACWRAGRQGLCPPRDRSLRAPVRRAHTAARERALTRLLAGPRRALPPRRCKAGGCATPWSWASA
jgi:hypothetical protein